MTEKNIEIKMIKDKESRFFVIFIFDREIAREIVNLLKVKPAVDFANKLKLNERDSIENYYLKLTILGTISGGYVLSLENYKTSFTLLEPSILSSSKKFKSIINCLFKNMEPEQRVKLTYWLEGIE